MPGDGYDSDRDPYDSNSRGRIWENGTDRRYRDRENGFAKPLREQEHQTSSGVNRRYDKQRGDSRNGPVRAIEDKSGEIGGRKDESQLRRDRELLERGAVEHLLLRSVEGEPIGKVAQELIDGLTRDFPDRFTHQIISRHEARDIWARGLQREPNQQLELPGVGEKARQQKDRQREARQQEREREERARVEREAAERVTRDFQRGSAKQIRAREDGRDKAEPPAVAKERADPAQQAKGAREREEAQSRAMVNSLDLNLSKEQKEQVQAILWEGRENQRKDVAREIEATRGNQPPTPPPSPHRTPQQERENARAIAKEAGLSPEIAGILGLNSSAPPPMIDVDQARTHPEAEAERSKHQQRERERAERERESRHRGE